MAWCCTYAPDAVADLTVPVQMAEAALAGYPADQKRFALNTLGAALYRAGRIDEAIARLDESVKASGGVGVPQDWVFLAMAHHKKGNGDEARRWLEKVRAYVKDEKIAFSSDLVETRILLREAEALLREPPRCDPERPRPDCALPLGPTAPIMPYGHGQLPFMLQPYRWYSEPPMIAATSWGARRLETTSAT